MNTLTTLECLVQNRLGALDRVLSALTHRGILPRHMEAMEDTANRTVRMRFAFQSDDEQMITKLVKFLQKQVYVLSATATLPELSPETSRINQELTVA